MLMERGAAVLREAGLRPGDTVLLCVESCPVWPVAFFAILEAGLIAVPLAAETPAASAIGVAAFADARVAIVSQRTRGLTAAGTLRCIAVEQLFGTDTSAGSEPLDRVPGRSPTGVWEPESGSSELALLAFTSGSTQKPRAVELTHANILANVQALLQVRQAGPGDSFLSMLPPAHLFELTVGLLGPLACGARVVYAPSLLPHRLVASLREERITHALSVPALLEVLYEEVVNQLVEAGVVDAVRRGQSLAETARRLRDDLTESERQELRRGLRERLGPSFQTLAVGGAALDPAWAGISAAVGLRLEVGYGLTEASPIVSLALASGSPPGSAGRLLPGIDVRLGENHEILVRGPSVMRGYWRDPETTAEALRDGWLHTGDCGRLDADGFLFITGRLKEALVTAAGETLYPEEVEPYYSSSLFAEWCVAALPGPHGNDLPTLFVVPVSPDADEQLLRHAFEDLRAAAPPRFRVANLVRLDSPLPRTALGKVRRRVLAQEWHKRGASP
jgi:long-chain acyl-CoA synthetase